MTTSTTLYDCKADYFDWRIKWSRERTSWCCTHFKRACPVKMPTPPPLPTLPGLLQKTITPTPTTTTTSAPTTMRTTTTAPTTTQALTTSTQACATVCTLKQRSDTCLSQ